MAVYFGAVCSFAFVGVATLSFYVLPYTTLFRSPDRVDAWCEAYRQRLAQAGLLDPALDAAHFRRWFDRSEEHTSELQSRFDLVCRLLLEKKKKSATLVSITDITLNVI